MNDVKVAVRSELPAAKEARSLLEEWFSLAWRPAGARSLSQNWMRAGELSSRAKRSKRGTRRTG